MSSSFAGGIGGCPGDLNGDGVVDGSDLAIVIGAWGTSGPTGDPDGSGFVDGRDIGYILAHWGPCLPPIFGPLYSMQLTGMGAQATTDMGPSSTAVDMDLTVMVDAFSPTNATRVIATHAAFYATSVPAQNPFSVDPSDQATGGMYMGIKPETPEGTWNQLTGAISVPMLLDMHYWLMDQYSHPVPSTCDETGGDSGYAPHEAWECVFQGHAFLMTDPTGEDFILFQDFTYVLAPKTPPYPPFCCGGKGITGGGSAPAPKKTFPGLGACPDNKKANKNKVCIQPVFIKFGPNAGDVTGASLADMKAKAETIWAKCCIEFEWKTPIIINKPEYKDLKEADEDKLKDEVDKKSENDCIEVYFVARMIDNSLPPKGHRSGDGVAWLRSDKAIVADQATTGCNPKADGVLAHELGHAMGGLGHDDAGAAGTVMVPTGMGAGNCPGVNSSKVKAFQCDAVRSRTKEKAPKDPCCLNPDPN